MRLTSSSVLTSWFDSCNASYVCLDLVEARGFLDTLIDLLSDSNPMVVSNAVAALTGNYLDDNMVDCPYR